MWSKVDDALADHRKVIAAADLIGGEDGLVVALGFYLLGLLWANRHLSDGILPESVVSRFGTSRNIQLADAMVRAGLWHRVANGYQIHDFTDFNFTAAEVKARRERDRKRKKNGHFHE